MKKLFTFIFFLILCIEVYSQPPVYTAVVSDSSLSGYYFLSVFRPNFNASTQIIMDVKGNIVYYRKFPIGTCLNFKVQPNGIITYNVRGKFYLTDSTLIPFDSLTASNGYTTDAHEFHILSNGHYLFLAEETVIMDLSMYNYFHNNGAPGSPTASVICGVIQELDENKNLVYEWHVKDHVSFDSVDPFWLNDSANVDWNHANAVEVDSDGNLLLSSRHLDEITKINKATGNIIWRLGGRYNQFNFLDDTVRFSGQHDIRRLFNGNITLFDNGWNYVSHGARAMEYQLDETNLNAQTASAYIFDSSMLSYSMGNNQRSASGLRIIDYGVSSALRNICFNVVKPDNSQAFELFFYDTLYSYRTFYYPQLPFSFPRPQVTCFDSAGVHYLEAPSGYTNYTWSTGATTRAIAVTSAGTYHVFVPYGQSGYLSSEQYVVSDITNPCALGIIDVKNSQPGFTIYPNPAHSTFNIFLNELKMENVDLKICDITGREVYSEKIRNSKTEIRNTFSSGVYLVKVYAEEGEMTEKLVVQ